MHSGEALIGFFFDQSDAGPFKHSLERMTCAAVLVVKA